MMSTKYFKNSIEKKAFLPTYRFVTSTKFLIGLLVFAVFLAALFMYPAFGASSPTGAYVKHLYTEYNGSQFVYGFKICAGNLNIHDAIVLVSSDSQTITVTSDDMINAGKCGKTFDVQIQADDQKSIHATLIDNTYV